jgi:hypothetical protein
VTIKKGKENKERVTKKDIIMVTMVACITIGM